jgi:hypothetical protein
MLKISGGTLDSNQTFDTLTFLNLSFYYTAPSRPMIPFPYPYMIVYSMVSSEKEFLMRNILKS